MEEVDTYVTKALQEIEDLRTDVPTWTRALQAVKTIATSRRKHLFRPQLVLIGFAAGSRQPSWDFARDLPQGVAAFAAGVELQHLFMFVHDDMMDNARTRRGHDTVHVAIATSDRDQTRARESSSPESSGRPHSLDPGTIRYLTTLVGDVLQAKSAALLAQGEQIVRANAPLEACPSACDIVFDGAFRAGAAQFDDILGWPGLERTLNLKDAPFRSTNSADADAENALMMRQVMDKAASHSFTAPLLGGLRLGALVSSDKSMDPSALEKSCRDWAEHAGAAFQAIDDAMDLILDPQDSGKDRLQDFQEGRLSVPLFVLRQQATSEEWDNVLRVFAAKAVMSPAERHLLLKLAAKYRLAEATLDLAENEIKTARSLLPGDSPLLKEGLDLFMQGLADLSATLRARQEQNAS